MRAEALANMKNIPFRVKVFDENGKLDYKVRVNTADVKADTTLYVYKYDSKTKTFNMVESEYQKISSDAKANIFCDFEKLNMENVSSIRYATTDQKIATVSESGKITAIGSGTVVIKATVTLLNGKTKTVRMTIKVK